MDRKKIIAGVLFILLIALSLFAAYLTFGKKPAVVPVVPQASPAAEVAPVVPVTPEATPTPVPVASPAPAAIKPIFKITKVEASVAPTTSDTCSPATTFSATGQVMANAAGTANYRWDKSDGTFTSTQSIVFTSSGAKGVTGVWNLAEAGSRWMKLHILTPGDILSDPVSFTLTCPFRVNRVEARETGVTGDCTAGKKVKFEGLIEANASGDVSYIWKRSDGASSSTPTTIHFDAPGTKTVTTEWNLWTAYSGWEQIQTTAPNVLTSGKAEFSITCP